MLNSLPLAQKIQRMNRRQHKKLRVGEFQELVFGIHVFFCRSIGGTAYDVFLDDFIMFIESRHLQVGGMGGQLAMDKTDGVVAGCDRNSPTEEDRQMVLDWLDLRPEVAIAEAGEFVDAWYGWEETP